MRLASALLITALIMGCGRGERARSLPTPTLEELAAGWSGGRTDPTCSDRGPRGEYLGHLPGTKYCQWPTLIQGARWSRVGGERMPRFGFGMITWERKILARSEVTALVDSLRQELLDRGLHEHQCPDGWPRWDNARLALKLLAGGSDSLQVSVLATTVPDAFQAFCPGEEPSRRGPIVQ